MNCHLFLNRIATHVNVEITFEISASVFSYFLRRVYTERANVRSPSKFNETNFCSSVILNTRSNERNDTNISTILVEIGEGGRTSINIVDRRVSISSSVNSFVVLFEICVDCYFIQPRTTNFFPLEKAFTVSDSVQYAPSIFEDSQRYRTNVRRDRYVL